MTGSTASAATSSPQPDDGSPLVISLPVADRQQRVSSYGILGSNAVTVLTGLAFVTMLVTYAIFGDYAAGIAFWAVMFGLPALLLVVSALGAAWRGNQRDERLEVALLALRLSEQQRGDSSRAAAIENLLR